MSPREVTGEAAGEIRHLVPDVETLAQRLGAVDYLVDEGLATSMYLSLRLPQPLLLEGEAGVGKTEAGKALAAILDTPLVRLQCYDGIDPAEALYEWNYPRQLLSIRLADSRGSELGEEELFGTDYLIRRPLLRALEQQIRNLVIEARLDDQQVWPIARRTAAGRLRCGKRLRRHRYALQPCRWRCSTTRRP